MLDLGLIPTKPGNAVDLRGLNQVIDYPARDMTITVQAGITIDKLNEVLRSEKQRLAVEVPLPDRATLGGAIAANASGRGVSGSARCATTSSASASSTIEARRSKPAAGSSRTSPATT